MFRFSAKIILVGLVFFLFLVQALHAQFNFYPRKDITSAGTAVALRIADFDGDGRGDLLAVHEDDQETFFLYRTSGTPGNTVFSSPVVTQSHHKGAVAVGDLDGDGLPDIAIADQSSQSIVIFRNRGGGSMAFDSVFNFSVGDDPVGLVVQDLDGDGKAELLIDVMPETVLQIFHNGYANGAWTFAQAGGTTLGPLPAPMGFGDFDGDGKTDLAMVSGNLFLVMQNKSTTGQVVMKGVFTDTIGNGKYPVQVDAADLNGDGKPDLVFSAFNQGAAIAINRSSGAGNFVFDVISLSGTVSGLVAPADFNGDGRIDLAAMNQDSIVRLYANGGGNVTSLFQPDTTFYRVAAFPVSLVAGDLTGDGKPDFAVSSNSLAEISFLENAGGSTTTTPAITSVSPDSAYAGDTVVIRGTHLSAPTSVTFGGVAAVVLASNDTALWVRIQQGGSGVVTVTTATGSGSLPGFVFLQHSVAHTQLYSFAPAEAGTGDSVLLRGANLSGLTAVRFGNVPAADFTVLSDSQVLARVGSGASGMVWVDGPGGADSLGGFAYRTVVDTPRRMKLNSFSPASAAAGQSVEIFGENLSQVTMISFGNTTAVSFQIVSDSEIVAIVTDQCASGFVKAFSPDFHDSLPGFTLLQGTVPILSFFDPAASSSGGIVHIHGTNLDSVTAVAFGGVPASGFSVSGDTLITATPGPGASGNIVVTTASGIDSLSGFSYVSTIFIYPNPVTDQLTVNFDPGQHVTALYLRTTGGTPVRTWQVPPGAGSATVSVAGIPPGLYVISWGDGASSSSEMVMIR